MKKFELNRVDEKGNIISGYQEIVETESYENAVSDYLYFLASSEGIEDPKCECIEVDWESPKTRVWPITKFWESKTQNLTELHYKGFTIYVRPNKVTIYGYFKSSEFETEEKALEHIDFHYPDEKMKKFRDF